MWRRLRLASVQVSDERARHRSSRAADDLQECVVERRHLLGELRRLDPGIAEPGEDAGHVRYRAVRGDRQRCSFALATGVALAELPCGSSAGPFVVEGQLDQPTRHELLQLAGRPTGDDAALVQDRDVVGQLIGLIEILRREEHGRPAVGQLADRPPHLVASLRVEPAGGLVQEDDCRTADQAHGDVEAAAHPTGIGRHAAICRLLQPEPPQQVRGGLAGIGDVAQVADQPQVLAPRQPVVDGGELPRQADLLAHLVRSRGDVVPGHRGRAAVGPDEGGQDVDRRCLAGAVTAQQGEDRPLLNAEADVFQNGDVLVRLAE